MMPNLSSLRSSHPLDARAAAAAPPLRVSVVVPCFNEEDSLPELHRRASAACHDAVGDSYEMILIDDGSSDLTWVLINQFSVADPHIVGVRLSRNYGHQYALSAGLAEAVGERILVLDADLQDPPELLGDMMRLMDSGADVVYGQRAIRFGETWFKRWSAARFYRLLNHLVDIPIPADTGDFRLLSRRVLDHLNTMPEQYRFVRGMISWLGFHQVPLVYARHERFAGTTKYPLRRMVKFAIDAITSFSIRPLRIASLLGIAFGTLGLFGLVYALGSWVLGGTVQGWASVIVTVLLLSSVQLFVLGIFGEYVGRLYLESKRRPTYVIDEIVGRPAAFAAERDLRSSAAAVPERALAVQLAAGERQPSARTGHPLAG